MTDLVTNTMTSRAVQLLTRVIGLGLASGAVTLIGQQTLGAEDMVHITDLAGEMATVVVGIIVAMWDLILHKRATGGVMKHPGLTLETVAHVKDIEERIHALNRENEALRDRFSMFKRKQNANAGEATDGPTSPRPMENQ